MTGGGGPPATGPGQPRVAGPAVRPQQLPWHTRVCQALRLLAEFVLAPLLIGGLLGPRGAGLAATLGAVLVLASSMANGRRATRYAAPLMLVAAALGAVTKPGWAWVVVLAVLAASSGVATRWGAGLAVSMATLQAATAPAIDDLGQLVAMLGFTLAGAVYGWVMAARLGAPRRSPAPRTTRRYTTTLAVGLGLAVAAAATFAVVTDWPHATWMVTAVVALGIPTPGLTERQMGQRMLGQLGACAIVTVITLVTTNLVVLLVAALVVLTLYLMSLGRPLAEQVAYLSAFFMLPAAAATSGTVLVVERLAYNLLGIGILTLVLVALRWARPRAERRVLAGAPSS